MSDLFPPIRSAAEMLPHSAWAAEIPGLREQAEQWLREFPSVRTPIERKARALATPALHPAGVGRLLSVAGRLLTETAAWATVDLGKAVYRAAVYGERGDDVP